MISRTLHRLGKPFTAQARSVLLFAVVIAQVQLPLPVAHDHDFVASESTLASHVDRWHAGEADSGVHWHWVLPRQGNPQESPADDSLPVPAAWVGDQAVAWVTTASTLAMDRLSANPPTIGVVAVRDHQTPIMKRSAHEISPASSADYSCAVLCVIRC